MADPLERRSAGTRCSGSGQLDALHHWPRTSRTGSPGFRTAPSSRARRARPTATTPWRSSFVCDAARRGLPVSRQRLLAPRRHASASTQARRGEAFGENGDLVGRGGTAPRARPRGHGLRGLRPRVARIPRRASRRPPMSQDPVSDSGRRRRNAGSCSAVLRIEMLPGGNGDALWIEYGDAQSPRRLIVDGGTEGSRDARAASARGSRSSRPTSATSSLLVVTHARLRPHRGSPRATATTHARRDVQGTSGSTRGSTSPTRWSRSAGGGRVLTETIVGQGLPWNDAFGGGGSSCRPTGRCSRMTLADELKITVLGPGLPSSSSTSSRSGWKRSRKPGSTPTRRVPEPEPPPPGLGVARRHARTSTPWRDPSSSRTRPSRTAQHRAPARARGHESPPHRRCLPLGRARGRRAAPRRHGADRLALDAFRRRTTGAARTSPRRCSRRSTASGTSSRRTARRRATRTRRGSRALLPRRGGLNPLLQLLDPLHRAAGPGPTTSAREQHDYEAATPTTARLSLAEFTLGTGGAVAPRR